VGRRVLGSAHVICWLCRMRMRVACGYMSRVEGSGEINLYEHDFGDESFPLPFYYAILPLIPRSSYHFLCRLLTRWLIKTIVVAIYYCRA
jgi:hypothetical protein